MPERGQGPALSTVSRLDLEKLWLDSGAQTPVAENRPLREELHNTQISCNNKYWSEFAAIYKYYEA